jgi:hypothetical protein
MNPHSNVSKLFAQPLGEQDHTVIFHIPLPQLMINDIFVDDHNHYWSISEELSRMTPDKNPLTNLPFEPEEWSRILKAREWGNKVDHPVPKPVEMRTIEESNSTSTTLVQIPSIPSSYEPISNYGWNDWRWICCQNPFQFTFREESYDVECRCMCMYMRRNNGPYSGKCRWCVPCFCNEVGKEDGCYPMLCMMCLNRNSCLFRQTNTSGCIWPAGWIFDNEQSGLHSNSCCIINNCYTNRNRNIFFITSPIYCHCSKNGKECCMTPLCLEVGDCFMTPFVCNKGSLFCFLGIPFMKYTNSCQTTFDYFLDCECCS